MSSVLSIALDLDRRLENSIAGINARLRTLDEQMRLADEILADFDVEFAPRSQEMDVDDFEREDLDSSGYESDVTVAYYTMDENRYFSDEDDDLSDTETIVGDWDDPFLTPERKQFTIYMPADLEDGLDFLNH